MALYCVKNGSKRSISVKLSSGTISVPANSSQTVESNTTPTSTYFTLDRTVGVFEGSCDVADTSSTTLTRVDNNDDSLRTSGVETTTTGLGSTIVTGDKVVKDHSPFCLIADPNPLSLNGTTIKPGTRGYISPVDIVVRYRDKYSTSDQSVTVKANTRQTVYSTYTPVITSGQGQVLDGACDTYVATVLEPATLTEYCLTNYGAENAVFEITGPDYAGGTAKTVVSTVTVSPNNTSSSKIYNTSKTNSPVSATQGGPGKSTGVIYGYPASSRQSVKSTTAPKILSAEVNYWYGSGYNTPNYLASSAQGACSEGRPAKPPAPPLNTYCVRVTISHQVTISTSLDSNNTPVTSKTYVTAGSPVEVRSYITPVLSNIAYGTVTPGACTATPNPVDPGTPNPVDPGTPSITILTSYNPNPTIKSNSTFPGEIFVDGVSVGRGERTVTAVVGRTYRISFGSISVSGYNFSTPGERSIQVTTVRNYLVEGIYDGQRLPGDPELVINTTYSPSLPAEVSQGEIFVDGSRVGIGQTTVVVKEGEHTVSFGGVRVPNWSYDTPASIKITVRKDEVRRLTGNYIGKKLPQARWLLPINSQDIKENIVTVTTETLFSEDTTILHAFFTGSTQLEDYYYHVYHRHPVSNGMYPEAVGWFPTASIQFSIAYGHFNGSGSIDDNGQIDDTPSKVIYRQYANTLGTPKTEFNLSGEKTNSIYVLNFQAQRVKNGLEPDRFEINLAHLSGSQYIAGGGTMSTHTGSNVTLQGTNRVLRLITDKSLSTLGTLEECGTVYNIVSGSLENGVYSSTSPLYFGKLFVNHGVVLLDGHKLDQSASFGTVLSSEVGGENQAKLFKSISGSALLMDNSGDYLGMKGRAYVHNYINYYFLKAENKELNYSNNPTFVTGSENEIIQDFKRAPLVYPTTVGLYNSRRELLAVGKISQPISNSFIEEVNFTAELKF